MYSGFKMGFLNTERQSIIFLSYAPVICNHGPYGEQSRYNVLTFLLANPRYMPKTVGHSYDQNSTKSPTQIPAGKCIITTASLCMESKLLLFNGTAVLVKTWQLGPTMSTQSRAPGGRSFK